MGFVSSFWMAKRAEATAKYTKGIPKIYRTPPCWRGEAWGGGRNKNKVKAKKPEGGSAPNRLRESDRLGRREPDGLGSILHLTPPQTV